VGSLPPSIHVFSMILTTRTRITKQAMMQNFHDLPTRCISELASFENDFLIFMCSLIELPWLHMRCMRE